MASSTLINAEPIVDPIDPNSARLYAIVARRARRAVVFRRGPSRAVRLLIWNLETDQIEGGQWFKGRIRERRCDLTPFGDRLVYFAASFRRPLHSWTALSRPPYLTALALWPKGDSWGGGGLFDTGRRLRLNHRPQEMQLAAGFALPPRLTVEPLGVHSGDGEDEPILSLRMIRDGWARASDDSKVTKHGGGARYSWSFDPPITMQKPIDRQGGGDVLLRQHLHAIFERRGRRNVETADLANVEGQMVMDFGRVDWTDLDHNGDVLYATNGCLFRLPRPTSRTNGELLRPCLVADLNAMTFERMQAPAWALERD